jgi:hypothetical protein
MKKYFFIAGLIFLAACSGNNNKQETGNADSAEEQGVAYDITPVWSYTYDSATGAINMKKLRELNKEETSAPTLVMILNTTWPDIQLQLLKTSQDTLYVSIPQSETLTQQMGSTGATQYMAIATYTLTEAQGIRYVNFDFTEGDHAEPGTYSRTDFSKGF